MVIFYNGRRAKKMKVRLINEFHKTLAVIVPKPILDGRFQGYYRISRNAVLRSRSKLCGNRGCTCGGNFGERGRIPGQPVIELISLDYDNNYIVNLLQVDE